MNNLESKPKDLEMVEGWLAIARENNNKLAIQIIENLFPKLRESDDKRIKKELIEFLERKQLIPTETKNEWIAWLEKQGEKLPVGFYYVNSEGKKFYSDTFKYGNVILHVEKQGEQNPTDKIEPKQEWSKEDNKMLNDVIQKINQLDHYWNKPTDEKMIDWLKSLKPQNRWKPNEKQMEALETAVRCRAMPWEQLGTLYNDLKTL